MRNELTWAWEQVNLGTDEALDRVAREALAIAGNGAEPALDRADAMFLLGQIARFFQPWRCPDDGVQWFRSAIGLFPEHIDSLLALCEIAARRFPKDGAVLSELLPTLQRLTTSMTAEHKQQCADLEYG